MKMKNIAAMAALAIVGLLAVAQGRFELRSPGSEATQRLTQRLDLRRPAAATGAAHTNAITQTDRSPRVTTPGAAPRRQAATAADNLPSLTGLLYHSSAWGNNKAFGIYNINPATGATTLVCPFPEAGGSGSMAGTIANGKFYGSYCEDFFGIIGTLKNYTLDLSTGQVSEYVYENPVYEDVACNMTFDSSTQTIYSINYDETINYYALCTFNPQTNQYTRIGDLQQHYYALCSDSRGHLYAITDLGDVVEVDPATGVEERKVASTGIEPLYAQSCTWSPKDSRIYWAACNDTYSALVTIDPATGVVATATTFPNDEEIIAISCSDPAEDPDSPARIADLAVGFTTGGSLSGTIHGTAPLLTVGGSRLNGDLTLTADVDGTTVATTTVKPGEKFDIGHSFTEGLHTIEVACSNAAGRGTRARIMTFAGVDRPAEITDLTAALANGDPTTVNLHWSAPATGEQNGWFDPAVLSYNVVRNDQVIARNLRATTYTDHLDPYFASNTYSIEVLYNGVAVSGSIRCTITTGSSLALPYTTEFNSSADFGLFSVINNNADSNTWFFDEEYNTASYNFSKTNPADDYLVTPLINALEGHVYRMEFFARSASASYPDRLEVVWGAAPEASALSEVLMAARNISNEGEQLSVEVAATANTPLYFAFHCVSPRDMSRLFIDDIRITDCGRTADPAPASNFTATPAADGSLQATVSFTAPTTTLGGTPLQNIDKIEVMRNGELFHTFTSPAPGEQLTVTDTQATFGFCTYSAIAYAAGSGTNPAESRVFVGVYTLPFSVIPTAEEYSLFTIPGGETDTSWFYDIEENALKATTYSYMGNDKYIFTPAIEFTNTNLVDLTFSYRAGSAYDQEEIEVTLGTTPDPSTHTPIHRFTFNNTAYKTTRVSFPVEASGRYYVGFHCVSQTGRMMMLVRDIILDRGALLTAPDAPTAMTVGGAPQGQLIANVDITLPTTALDGTPLEGTVGAVLMRADGTVADELTNLRPGSSVTLTDSRATLGFNTYTVATTNANGMGGRRTETGWIGVDVPGPLSYLEVLPTTDNLRAELSWEAPTTTLHGGWFDPSNLTYKIYQLQDNSLYLIDQTTNNEATVSPMGLGQDYYTFYVTASNDAGEGRSMNISAVLGTPYELPLIETASNGIVTALPWLAGSTEGDVNWGTSDYIGSIDLMAPDGGMFVCSAMVPERRPGSATMQLPKLCFNGLNAPTLTFSMYHYPAQGTELSVKVTTDELEYTEVFKAQTATLQSALRPGWKTYSVNLAQYKDANWVAIVFDGQLTDGTSYIIVDDISVANRSERDLRVNRVTGPISPEAGREHNYTVEVLNDGSAELDFDLEMRVNGNRETLVAHDEKLAGGATASITLPLGVLAEHINNPLDVEIEVLTRNWTDEIPANNTSRFSLTAVQPALPLITDLSATASLQGGASLKWTAPDLTAKPITDSFENYPSFAYEAIGEYTTLDLDGLIPCGISGVQFPNMGTPMAFQVWEPRAEGVDVDAEIWQPYSGNKCLVAWTALSSYVEPFNDDWLISPMLAASDAPQTVDFQVRRPVGTYGNESYEILYSDGSTDTADFTLLKSEIIGNGQWNHMSYTLPASARRFAIRYTSRNRFALLFDDLCYTPLSAATDLSIEGFKVYRNGSAIATTAANETSFETTGSADGNYNVATLYNSGESGLSNTARIAAGIDTANAEATVSVTGHAGYIEVKAPAGTNIVVVAPDGTTAASADALAGTRRIELPAGVYLVTAANRTFKVAVK